MRAVLDTNVLISGLLWRGVPHACLIAAEAGLFEFVTADSILQELHDKLVEKFKHTTAEADSLVANLRRRASIVAISGRSGWVTSDPDDDKFVDAALAASAEYIVSGDHHLLGLGSVAGVSVLRPREFLDRIRSDKSE
jgi:putative PIN family toxin of toxin-antitoxin system